MTSSLFKHGMYWFALLIMMLFSVSSFAEKSVNYQLAFYYGDNPPLDQLKFYPNVVIAPIPAVDPSQFTTKHRNLYAYVSLGEVVSLQQYPDHRIDSTWIMAKNEKWQSLVLDQSNVAWQQFFLQEIITPLWEEGYRAFFLDTVDSYRLATTDAKVMAKQQAGIITMIRSIKAKYPEVKLITNRGFEIMADIRPYIDGVIAESLFAGWDNEHKRYVPVKKAAREWLLKELNQVKAMGLPVTVVDYLGVDQAKRATSIAQKIAELGFNPWVTDGDLTELYLFNTKLIPRKILLFYQGELNNVDEKVGSYISKIIDMPLNYMGYVTEVHNIREPLSDHLFKNIAGIVVAIDGFLLGRENELYHWYLSILKKKIPLVILNNFGFPLDNFDLKPFQLSMPAFSYAPHTVRPSFKAPMVGYETEPIARVNDFVPVTMMAGTRIYQQVDEIGTKGDMAAIMPWGAIFYQIVL